MEARVTASFADDLFRSEAGELSGFSLDKTLTAFRGRVDFYVTPDGIAMPSTAYRYMDTRYTSRTISSMSAPGSYFTFTKFDTAASARGGLQIDPIAFRNDAHLRGTFDTLQLGNNWYVPKSFGGDGLDFEPITNSYPHLGPGGHPQLKTKKDIIFDEVDIIP